MSSSRPSPRARSRRATTAPSHVLPSSSSPVALLRTVVLAAVVLALVAGFVVQRSVAGAAVSVVAQDSFARTAASGWGSAEIGGAWTTSAGAPVFTTANAGLVTIAPDGVTPSARLAAVSSTSTDLKVDASVDRLADGNGTYVFAVGRQVAGVGQYAAKLHVLATGALSLGLIRRDAAGVETILAAETATGAVTAPGAPVHVRVTVTGQGTTSIQARAWSGATEPTAWLVSADDTTAGLQVAGSVGVAAFLSTKATNGPVTVSFTGVTASATTADPVASPTPATTDPAVTTDPTATDPTATDPTSVDPATTTDTATTTLATTSSTRKALSAGSVALGGTAYSIPAGAKYVAVTGSDTAGTGTATAPYRTLAKAIASSASGTTIVLRRGSYHESVSIPSTKRLTIQSYPGEAVWLDGSRAVAAPVYDAGRYRIDGYTWNFDHSPTYTSGVADNTATFWKFVSSSYPMASHPDQVWIGGARQRQVGSLASVVAGTFYVDTANDKVYLGTNPNGAQVRVSDLQTAITVMSSGTVLRGFGIHRYATSVPLMGTLRAWSGATNLWLENLIVQENATQGIFIGATGATVRKVTADLNGLLGLQANYADGIRIASLRSTRNNLEHFNRTPVSGGVKITRTRGIYVAESTVSSNYGQGMWFDESSYSITAVRNDVVANQGDGIRFEISQKVVAGDNVVQSNTLDGIRFANTGGGQVWNNTLTKNSRDLNITQDSRLQSNLSLPGHDPRQTLPDSSVPWKSFDITVRNNVFDNGNGTGNAILGVEDWTKTWSAEQMRISTNNSGYLRASSTSPKYVVIWSAGSGNGGNPYVYTTLGGFQSSKGQERQSVMGDNGAALPAGTPAGLPADIAATLLRPAGEAHLGAYL